jgi:hypothetical protein
VSVDILTPIVTFLLVALLETAAPDLIRDRRQLRDF